MLDRTIVDTAEDFVKKLESREESEKVNREKWHKDACNPENWHESFYFSASKECRNYMNLFCLEIQKDLPEELRSQFANFISKCIKKYEHTKLELKESFEPIEPFEENALDQLPSFNPDWLPGLFKQYAIELAKSLQVDISMVASSMLGIISTAIQNKFKVHAYGDWYEPVNLYMFIVADPSSKKTPTLDMTGEPITKYIEEYIEAHEDEILSAQARMKVLNAKEAGILKTLNGRSRKKEKPEDQSNGTGGTPQDQEQRYQDELKEIAKEKRELEGKTEAPRLTVSNATPEAMIPIMKKNHECLSIISDEASDILDVLGGIYASGQAQTGLFAQGYSGSHYQYDRATNKTYIELSHPALTALLMMQKSVLADATSNKKFVSRGITARPFFVFPPAQRGQLYKTPGVNPVVKDDYIIAVKSLLKIPYPAKPIHLSLSEAADREFEKLHDHVETYRYDSIESIADWAGKEKGNALRLAASLHCMKMAKVWESVTASSDGQPIELDSNNLMITEDTMKVAVEMTKFYEIHSLYALGFAGLGDSPEVADAKKILRKLKKMYEDTGSIEISKRNLFQKCRPAIFRKVSEMEPGLLELVKRNYVRTEERKSDTGRPSEIIILNPAIVEEIKS